MQGRVTVNGRSAILGQKLARGDAVRIDGRLVEWEAAQPAPAVLAYYKPAGQISSRVDPERRPTIFEALPRPPGGGRWVAVGRLDLATSGLLLFTTDGELAHRLMHPRYEIEREYAVRLLGRLTDEQQARLLQGVEIEGGVARLDSVISYGGSGSNVWYRVTLSEGRNREVRRLFEAVGIAVSRLIRVRYGPIQLGHLHRGQHRILSPAETAALYAAVGLGTN